MRKSLFLLMLATIIGCTSSTRRSVHSWPLGKERHILKTLNEEIDAFNKDFKNDSMRKELELPARVQSVKLTPDGMKMKLTFDNGEVKTIQQDEFDQTFRVSLQASFAEAGRRVGTGKTIVLSRKDF